MKKLTTITFCSSLVLLLSSVAASGFYDPNAQRWMNRDPLGEAGSELVRFKSDSQIITYAEMHPYERNLYAFLRNAPTLHKDSWGLRLTIEDCKNFRRDCLEEVTQIFNLAKKWGTGKSVLTAGGALAVTKQYGKNLGKCVGGVFSVWAIISTGSQVAQGFEMSKQCRDMYNNCILQATGEPGTE